MSQKVVILSAFQDYRTRKRASIQHIADGLVAAGHDVAFVSTRFSRLSRRTGDSRLFLADRANRIERVNGVACYLWRTPLHPFATGHRIVDRLMVPAYDMFGRWPDGTVDRLLGEADVVIVESSVAVVFLRRIRRLNPRCRIVYYAADRLDTVGAHPYLQRRLEMDAALIDAVCVRSSRMAAHFGWAADRLYRASFGINEADYRDGGANPYTAPRNAVSLGSMLFDPGYFQAVAPHFPDVTFHVIGCGEHFPAPDNVLIYPEMPFAETLPYLRHATIGIAAYRDAVGVEYLAESSLKLAQFEHFGIAAVCPDFAAGDVASRSGYRPADGGSMRRATERAFAQAGTVTPTRFPSWQDVASRVLVPSDFPENRL